MPENENPQNTPIAADNIFTDAQLNQEPVTEEAPAPLPSEPERKVSIELKDVDIYQKKMTVQRIPEAIRFSRLPDVGWCLDYDMSLAPSEYISTDIERLSRLTSFSAPKR